MPQQLYNRVFCHHQHTTIDIDMHKELKTMPLQSHLAVCFETPKTPEQAEDELRSHQKRKELVSTLPLDKTWPEFPLRHYQGFWIREGLVPGVMAIQDHFRADPTDVFLVTYPKCGATWLKALAFAISECGAGPLSHHPLLHRHPQECYPFLESLFSAGHIPDLGVLPSPRIFGTHMHYSSLRYSVRAAGCRIVYLCRDPKDTLVSGWYFFEGMRRDGKAPVPFAEAFEAFCDGRWGYGPMWEHMLEYWRESQRHPERVLFLRYEEMMEEPVRHVRKLAEFIGKPFSAVEESEGVVEEVVRMCSFDKLRGLEVNKDGILPTDPDLGLSIKKSSFFRKGKVGDWREHLSPEMAKRLDCIFQQKLEGSGLSFGQLRTPQEE